MRIDVVYFDRPPRVIETSNEGMLSASTVANAPEWRGAGLSVVGAMLRPRTDLLAGGEGLRVELCAWSAATDEWHEDAAILDFGYESQVPRLQLHVFRVWEVLPPEDVAHVTSIDIDGRIHVRRIGGRLLDLTAYERVEEVLLSRTEVGDLPLDQRVLLVHDRMRRANPGMDDDQVGESYGMGSALFDYALACGAGEARDDAVPQQRDGLDELVAVLAACEDREGLVLALQGAIIEIEDLTPTTLAKALVAREMDLGDVDDLWAEAEGRLMDDSSWGAPDWAQD